MKPKSKSGKREPTPTINPIVARISEVVERDLGEGWHPIAIIEARISGKFCEVRCVHSKGAQEVIKTYFREEVEREKEMEHENENKGFIPIRDDDIPF